MWIYTQHGFLSVVRSSRDPNRIKIRARRRSDLERIAALTDLPDIEDTPNRDYACRIHATPEQFAGLMEALAADLDYPNFKDRLHETRPEMSDVAWDVYAATERLADT